MTAIEAQDLGAIGWAILAMSIAILTYDQLLFRPLVAWAEKYRVPKQNDASQSHSAKLGSREILVRNARDGSKIAEWAARWSGTLERGNFARAPLSLAGARLFPAEAPASAPQR